MKLVLYGHRKFKDDSVPLRQEKWNFLKIGNIYCVFELRFEIRSLKLPLTPNFSLIHPKTKKQ